MIKSREDSTFHGIVHGCRLLLTILIKHDQSVLFSFLVISSIDISLGTFFTNDFAEKPLPFFRTSEKEGGEEKKVEVKDEENKVEEEEKRRRRSKKKRNK